MAASMKDIKLRIHSVEGTMQITRAMELVAASKLRRAQERMERSRPYFEILHETIHDIAGLDDTILSPYVMQREVKRTCWIVIAGDRGLAGGYNSSIFKLVHAEVADRDVIVVPIGKKALEYYRHKNIPVWSGAYQEAGAITVGDCFTMAKMLCCDFRRGEFDEIRIAFTTFASALSQTPIEQMAANASLQELDCLWEMLRSEVPESSSRDCWIIGNGIGILFSKLAQYDASKFVNCCKAYIDHQTPYCDERYSIINGLIKVLGYARAVEFVNCSTFGEKNLWLAILYDFVPDEYIDNCLIEKIMECLRGRGDREHYTVSLKTVLRINGKFPGYLKRYMVELNNLGEENPHLLSGFLFRVGHGECIGTKELVEYFRGDIKVLCTAYIYAHQGRSYYDFDGELFSELIRGNPEFLADYVHKVAGKQIGRDGWHALNILWQQDDYLKLISIVMECLKNATKPFFTWDSLAEDLLSSPINMPLVNKRRNEWIKYYVEANCYDGESMRFLFGIVCNLPEEQRLPAIVTFCQCNPAFEAFRSIYIIPTHASWSGSEVPILEQHIAFLSEIKDSLRGMQFVEHRTHISEKIRNLQERKEDVLLREFLEER